VRKTDTETQSKPKDNHSLACAVRAMNTDAKKRSVLRDMAGKGAFGRGPVQGEISHHRGSHLQLAVAMLAYQASSKEALANGEAQRGDAVHSRRRWVLYMYVISQLRSATADLQSRSCAAANADTCIRAKDQKLKTREKLLCTLPNVNVPEKFTQARETPLPCSPPQEVST